LVFDSYAVEDVEIGFRGGKVRGLFERVLVGFLTVGFCALSYVVHDFVVIGEVEGTAADGFGLFTETYGFHRIFFLRLRQDISPQIFEVPPGITGTGERALLFVSIVPAKLSGSVHCNQAILDFLHETSAFAVGSSLARRDDVADCDHWAFFCRLPLIIFQKISIAEILCHSTIYKIGFYAHRSAVEIGDA
jgi:hypothetical protein